MRFDRTYEERRPGHILSLFWKAVDNKLGKQHGKVLGTDFGRKELFIGHGQLVLPLFRLRGPLANQFTVTCELADDANVGITKAVCDDILENLGTTFDADAREQQ